jgi:prepilin-type processing-associated H-X9-DG protein/prepilin-type N-terminal cleavage/methylation domain-containing protein
MTDSYLPTQNQKGKARGAFTLVELMVAIGIVALLAGLLFPVMKGVSDRGKVTVCANNLKQLGLAFQQYLNDNQQRYPGGGQYQEWANGGHWIGADKNGHNAQGTNGGPVALTNPQDPTGQPYTGAEAKPEKGALYSYVKNAGTYVCPSEPNGEFKRLTYSMNCAIAGLNATVRMKKPAEVVLLVDENNANDGYFYTAGLLPTPASGSTDALSQNHLKGGNLLFCDGHVKFYSYASLPLDNPTVSPTAATLKTQLTGAPRFWDKAFDMVAPFTDAEGYYAHPVFGSCALPQVGPLEGP